ncbi:ABC transporter ATP-binding protein [Candidatus Woesearchaeota archaeon]|nr:ABC transporter ATP-binding protein [Candidatus Woesearchaeota archaeon]
MKPIIELEDVWKIYPMGAVSVPALQGISLKVGEGQFLALMGASGSGKSTAMNLVGCLDIPSRGNVFLQGRNIASLSESHLAQIRGKVIGFIFQQFNLIPTLSALENVGLPMLFQGHSRDEREKRALELLQRVGLEERAFHRPSELSGGQQQRVAIARALANDPKVILADEPTGNLDSATGKQVIAMLKELHRKEHKTIVMVTHDKEIAKHADRIVRLQDGKIAG